MLKRILYGVVVALLLAVVSPLLARDTLPTTTDNLHLISCAANLYAADNDDGTVLTQSGDAAFDKTWPVLLGKYLPDQKAFFDPARGAVTAKAAQIGAAVLPWSSVTSLSINDSGYTGTWATVGGSCTGRKIRYQYGGRKLHALSDPASRIAFAPTKYDDAHPNLGYSFFHSYDASWIKPNVSGLLFSWNNMVYNTNVSGKIPVVRADGSAGVLTKADFYGGTMKGAAASAAETSGWCAWINGDGGKTWGRFYKTD